jgi:predicted metal-dependent hydrolase
MTARSDLERRVVLLQGGPLAYGLRRPARSHSLRVTIDPRHGVVVSVPPPTRRGWAHPDGAIERFLADREPWLRRHLARLDRERREIADRGGIADGASFRYLGELHRLRIERAGPRVRRSSVARIGSADGDELLITLAVAERRPVADVLRAWLRERAGHAIDAAVRRHASAFGVQPARISLRDTRSRWGSASRTGTLSLSWRLVLAPPPALETVVIHELAHLREFGHGPAFWALVASRRPDHRVWRRWLRTHSHELHAALEVDPGG